MKNDHLPIPVGEASHRAPARQLSDDQILQQVEHQFQAKGSSVESKAPLIALWVASLACIAVACVAMGRPRPVEAARPTPRWINWTYSMEEGQARARKNQQKILIGFYTDWCPACKRMDSNVYTQPAVLAESQNVVMVKINAEGRPDLAKRYNIHVYPSFVWTDANGNETARNDGSAPAPQFAALMTQNR